MSTVSGRKNLVLFIVPLLTIIVIMPAIVVSIGIENFERLLLDKNPFAVALVAVFVVGVLFLFHKLIIQLE